jgi:hypothetical protein
MLRSQETIIVIVALLVVCAVTARYYMQHLPGSQVRERERREREAYKARLRK